jgi:hypothetical protein
LFQEAPIREGRVVVFYSDMRHATPGLDLESPAIIRADEVLTAVQRHGLLADLSGVAVYVLGADAAGKRVGQWESLKQFWAAYFKKAGANLLSYSILCEPPKLEH